MTARAYPTTAAAAAAAIPGATFSHGWLCNDVSGDMVPVFGGLTLTASGGILYGQTGPRGGADRCLEFQAPSLLGRFAGGANFDVGGTDDLVVAWVGLWTELPSVFGAMFGKVSAAFGNGWSVSGTDGTALTLGAGAGSTQGATISGTGAYHVGTWHVGIAVVDRSTGKSRIGTRSLGGVSVISSEGSPGSSSLSNASNFYVGRSDWVGLNDNFRFAALYIGKGSGAATGLSAGLSAALTRFAETISEEPTARDYARMLFSLLPPGKLWRVVGTKVYQFMLGCADELVRVHDRVTDMLDEADPTTAVELLPEYEADLAIAPPAATVAERQARIVSRKVDRQRFRPVDIQVALAPLLLQDPEDVVIIERDLAYVAGVGDQRAIFEYFVHRDPAAAPASPAYFLAAAQAELDRVQPSHVKGYVIESVGFLVEDPFSLTDRDLIGAGL
jgi:Bacteriophage Mu-like, Gp48